MVINFGNLPIAPVGVLVGLFFLGLLLNRTRNLKKRQPNEAASSNLHIQEYGEAVLRFRRKQLMTANEREFFGRLTRALPDYHVFPQIAFNALLDSPSGLCWRDRMQIRNHFDRKVADYVVCSRDTFEVIAVVELDDRTHNAEKDEKRDSMLKSADYQVLHFQSRRKPTEQEISEIFSP